MPLLVVKNMLPKLRADYDYYVDGMEKGFPIDRLTFSHRNAAWATSNHSAQF
ncbi:Hypothetical protein ETEE_0685 [Edwardsiella anguillarum ET080813]|uniref:Uncharacterized protein n=1 Tax=Edwardsiella anguillarum ET080813 TaxID=667120 RepID=A0A076LGA5_9GAMM|nr:Hypothetical protein ETEE_0685 [Edwardsiella anguillarum ET080813]